MQISRLFGIVYILLEKRIITAQELAERFEVSIRTIYRDIDALCGAGIPIYSSQGKGGGIRLLEDFILNKAVLSEKEQKEILIGLQSLSATQYPDTDLVLSKLSSIFKKHDMSWIEVDFSSWGSDDKEKENFNIIKNSVINNLVISFEYFNTNGEKSNRKVEPKKLMFKDKSWYLKGYCLYKKANRIFKITRMVDIEITKESCKENSNEESMAYSDVPKSLKMIHMKFRIAHEGAYRVYDDFKEKDIFKHEDGSFTVNTSMPEGEWLYNYILSFGTAMEVIEPKKIRNIIITKIEQMFQRYK